MMICWIARDGDEGLWIYTQKPWKHEEDLRWDIEQDHNTSNAAIINSCDEVFKDISWDDEEPASFVPDTTCREKDLVFLAELGKNLDSMTNKETQEAILSLIDEFIKTEDGSSGRY